MTEPTTIAGTRRLQDLKAKLARQTADYNRTPWAHHYAARMKNTKRRIAELERKQAQARRHQEEGATQ